METNRAVANTFAAYDEELRDYRNRRIQKDIAWRRAEAERQKELERKAAGYDAMIAAQTRVVVSIERGIVQSVYSNQPSLEVLIVDLDNVNDADDPRTAVSWKPSDLGTMPNDVGNSVKALDGDEIDCEQCGNTYRNEDGYGAWFCSKTCHDRHWRT